MGFYLVYVQGSEWGVYCAKSCVSWNVTLGNSDCRDSGRELCEAGLNKRTCTFAFACHPWHVHECMNYVSLVIFSCIQMGQLAMGRILMQLNSGCPGWQQSLAPVDSGFTKNIDITSDICLQLAMDHVNCSIVLGGEDVHLESLACALHCIFCVFLLIPTFSPILFSAVERKSAVWLSPHFPHF